MKAVVVRSQITSSGPWTRSQTCMWPAEEPVVSVKSAGELLPGMKLSHTVCYIYTHMRYQCIWSSPSAVIDITVGKVNQKIIRLIWSDSTLVTIRGEKREWRETGERKWWSRETSAISVTSERRRETKLQFWIDCLSTLSLRHGVMMKWCRALVTPWCRDFPRWGYFCAFNSVVIDLLMFLSWAAFAMVSRSDRRFDGRWFLCSSEVADEAPAFTVSSHRLHRAVVSDSMRWSAVPGSPDVW